MLVVGGTAILRPAVEALTGVGRPVVVLSRSRERLASLPRGSAGVVGDLADPVGLARVLAASGRRLGAGLAYLPAASAPGGVPVLGVLRAAVEGPLVVLLTSSAAATGGGEPVEPPAIAAHLRERLVADGTDPGDLRLLVLGWTPPGPGGVARWHTPAEISTPALDLFDDPAPRVLGVLRPWTDRPG